MGMDSSAPTGLLTSNAPTGLGSYLGRFPRTALRLSWANIQRPSGAANIKRPYGAANIQRPYGAGELFGALSQDCASLVLG